MPPHGTPLGVLFRHQSRLFPYNIVCHSRFRRSAEKSFGLNGPGPPIPRAQLAQAELPGWQFVSRARQMGQPLFGFFGGPQMGAPLPTTGSVPCRQVGPNRTHLRPGGLPDSFEVSEQLFAAPQAGQPSDSGPSARYQKHAHHHTAPSALHTQRASAVGHFLSMGVNLDFGPLL